MEDDIATEVTQSGVDSAGGQKEVAETKLPGSYAWRRYFARALDTSIVLLTIMLVSAFLIGLSLAAVNHGAVLAYVNWLKKYQRLNFFVDAFITVLLWLPIEALFLSTLRTTPGKWLFGIKVITQSGNKLRYRTAISRALLVFIQGQALMIPLVSLITLIMSYDRVTTKGSTYWDRDLKTVVTYDKLSDTRLVFCVLAVILWAFNAIFVYLRHFGGRV